MPDEPATPHSENVPGTSDATVRPSSPTKPEGESLGGQSAEPSAPNTAANVLRSEINARRDAEDDVETSLWSGGYSPKAMVGTWASGGLVSLAVLLATGFFWASFFVWAILVVVVIWAILGAMYGYRRLGVFYELTTQRFIHQSGILSRRTDRIEVIDIDDVSVKQGLVERMFGVGTVVIQSSDSSHPTLEMLGIADVKNVAKLVDDTRRKERRRRSLHIESI